MQTLDKGYGAQVLCGEGQRARRAIGLMFLDEPQCLAQAFRVRHSFPNLLSSASYQMPFVLTLRQPDFLGCV